MLAAPLKVGRSGSGEELDHYGEGFIRVGPGDYKEPCIEGRWVACVLRREGVWRAGRVVDLISCLVGRWVFLNGISTHPHHFTAVVGDTITLFSLRDFLRNKKFSKDILEQCLRRRRGKRGTLARGASNGTNGSGGGSTSAEVRLAVHLACRWGAGTITPSLSHKYTLSTNTKHTHAGRRGLAAGCGAGAGPAAQQEVRRGAAEAVGRGRHRHHHQHHDH